MTWTRYAIYAAPRPSPLADAAAAWLGWDPATGQEPEAPSDMPHPREALTAAARKYGFHATLKAPFRLAAGKSEEELVAAVAALATDLPAARVPALRLAALDGFLALVPQGETSALDALASQVVTALDPFRAPLTEADVARRRPQDLTPRQRAHLDRWGYPHVHEDFGFHMTLTGRLAPSLRAEVAEVLERRLLPLVPRPFAVEDLCLFAEAQDGRFRLISRHALTDPATDRSRAIPT